MQRPGTLVLLTMTLAVGCGGGYELPTASVQGTVTLDGEPAKNGYVTIVPAKGRMARGAIQSDGSFVMGTYTKTDGVQLGTHPVTVKPVPVDEGDRKKDRTAIPSRYGVVSTSGLKLEVTKGGVEDYLIELTSEE